MIVITVEGGLVQGVSSDDPAEVGKEVVIIDHDAAEGAEPEEVHKVPQGDGGTQEATIDRQEIGAIHGPLAECLRRMGAREACPKCGEPFDPSQDTVVECPRCHVEGSTRCCNPGGRNCPCAECEEGGSGG